MGTEARDETFTRRLGYLEHLKHHALDRIAAECGLYMGQPPILFMLANNAQKTQTEIAERLRVTPATIATSIKRMEKAGLLRKETHPTDQRRNLIVLTPEGEETVRKCKAMFDDMDQTLMSALSPEETQIFGDLLTRLIVRMEEYNEKNDTE